MQMVTRASVTTFQFRMLLLTLLVNLFFWQTGGVLAFHARGCGFDPHHWSYVFLFLLCTLTMTCFEASDRNISRS